MDEVKSIQAARQRLHEAVGNFRPPPLQALEISPYVGASLLQKAIRRGRTELALQASATLLEQSPERLWRRLVCIAFEDVGLGDLELVTKTTAAMAGKRVRATLGGEWPVASFLISKMADATKCRAADDLLLTAENHPDYEFERLRLGLFDIPGLIQVVTGSEPLPVRAIAGWYTLGTLRRPSATLRRRSGDPTTLFKELETILAPDLVELAREGHRRSSEVLPIFTTMLAPLMQDEITRIETEEYPPEVMIGDVPGWAVDFYTRPGRAALANFIEGSTQTARWVRKHIPLRQRVSFLGTIIFRIEGGCVNQRLRWLLGDELRRMVDRECNGRNCTDATEILQLAKMDLGELNAMRSELMKGNPHVG